MYSSGTNPKPYTNAYSNAKPPASDFPLFLDRETGLERDPDAYRDDVKLHRRKRRTWAERKKAAAAISRSALGLSTPHRSPSASRRALLLLTLPHARSNSANLWSNPLANEIAAPLLQPPLSTCGHSAHSRCNKRSLNNVRASARTLRTSTGRAWPTETSTTSTVEAATR